MALILDEVDSTNTYAREHFDALPDGTLVAARQQNAGRGRLGRKWLTPYGSCITASAVLKNVRDGFQAGCIVGLAALKLAQSQAPRSSLFLKWPNDLYAGHRKLAGLLGEGVVRHGKLQGVVMGVGLNVNLDEAFVRQIDQPATSLQILTKKQFDVENLLKGLEKFILEYYIIYSNSFEPIFAEWRAANRLLGRELTVIDPAGIKHKGIFRDVQPSGAMLFEENGTVREFTCGDVSIDKTTINLANNP